MSNDIKARGTYGNGGVVSVHIGQTVINGSNAGLYGSCNIDASSVSASGGNISLQIDAGSLRQSGTMALNTSGAVNGGAVTISSLGSIDNPRYSISTNGGANGGNISITAAGQIVNSQSMTSSATTGYGGSILIQSTGGSIDLTASSISSSSTAGAAGSISLLAPAGSVTIENSTPIAATGATFGGNISVTAGNGSISFGNSSSTVNTVGNVQSGNINLSASGNISAFGLNASSNTSPAGGTGGNVTISITSAGNLTLNGLIDARGNAGNGGTVSISVQQSMPTGANGMAGIIDNGSTINTSSVAGNAGNIRIAVASGTLGNTGTNNTSSLTLTASSTNGTGGNIAIAGAGDINTSRWVASANGQNGGTIAVSAGGAFTSQSSGSLGSTFQSDANQGTGGTAGTILITAPGGITTGFIESIGTVTGASGGRIILLSSAGGITINSNNGGALLNVSSTGTAGGGGGGQILVVAGGSGGFVTSTTNSIYASSASGSGGSISISALGAAAPITLGTSGWLINANGATTGGSIALVAAGAINVQNVANTLTAQGTGTGAAGGGIFVSQGSQTNALTLTNVPYNVSGGTAGSAVIMSNGSITPPGTVPANVGLFQNVSSSGAYTLLTAGNLISGNAYALVLQPGTQPYLQDLTAGGSPIYRLPAGPLNFGDISIQLLTFQTGSPALLAPLSVSGALSLTAATNSAVSINQSPVAVVSSGNLTVAGAVVNQSPAASVNNVALTSTGILSAGSILTGTQVGGSSGNLSVVAPAVNLGTAVNASGTGSTSGGGTIFVAATAGSISAAGTSFKADATGGLSAGKITLLAPFGGATAGSASAVAQAAQGGAVLIISPTIQLLGTTNTSSNTSIDVTSSLSSGGSIRLNGVSISLVAGNLAAGGSTAGGFITIEAANGQLSAKDMYAKAFGFTASQPSKGGVIAIRMPGVNPSLTVGNLSVAGLSGAAGGTVAILNTFGAVTVSSADASSGSNKAGNIYLVGASVNLTGAVANDANPTSAIDTSSGLGSGGDILVITTNGLLSTTNGSTGTTYDISAYGNGSAAVAGDVSLSARGGALQVGNINASGYNGCPGGHIAISNSTGAVILGAGVADGKGVLGVSASGSNHGGDMTISANTYVGPGAGATLNLDTSSSQGSGGSIYVTANDMNNQGSAIVLNDISTGANTANSGSSLGRCAGNVILASLTFRGADVLSAGDITFGTITATGTGNNGRGGSVGISTPGQLSAAGIVAAGTTYGGNVFISAGGWRNESGPDAQTHPVSVALSSGLPSVTGGSSGQVVLYSSKEIRLSSGAQSSYYTAAAPGANVGIFPNVAVSPATALSADTTITVTPSAQPINLPPGGFFSLYMIDSGSAGHNLTINTGGNGFLLAPVVSRIGTANTLSISGTQVTNNASAVALISRGDISLTGGSLNTAGGGTAGNGAGALLISSSGRISISNIVSTAANTNTFTTSAGSAGLIAPQGQVIVSGGANANSITTNAGASNGDVYLVGGSAITLGGAVQSGQVGAAGNVTFITFAGTMAIQTANQLTAVAAGSQDQSGGAVSFILGLTTNNGLSLAGSIKAGSGNGTSGAIELRVQDGSAVLSTGMTLDVSSTSTRVDPVTLLPLDFGGTVVLDFAGRTNQALNWTINADGPNGGSITLTSNGTMQLTGSGISVNATKSGGTAGSISIRSSSTIPLYIGQTTGSNYVAGPIRIHGTNGGSLTIVNSEGPVYIPNYSYDSGTNPTGIDLGLTDPDGSGTSITLMGTSLQVASSAPGFMNANAVSSAAGAQYISSNGGKITLVTSSPALPLQINQNVAFNANGGVNFVNSPLTAQSGSDRGNGGTITIVAAGGVQSAASSLSVKAAVDGGTINITTNTPNPLVVDTGLSSAPANGIFGVNSADCTTCGLAAGGGTVLGYGNGGSIHLINNGGRVDVEQSSALDISIQSGQGNGGNIYLEGTGLIVKGALNADGKNNGQSGSGIGTGNGGSLVLVSRQEALTTSSSEGTSYISGALSANGDGPANGGIISLYSGSIIDPMIVGGASVNPGATAGASALGGRINIFAGAGQVNLTGNLTTNGVSGSNATGGTVVIAVPGTDTANAVRSNGIVLALEHDYAATLNSLVSSGTSTGLTVVNTGQITAVGGGAGEVYFLSNSGSVDVADSNPAVNNSQIKSSGVISFLSTNPTSVAGLYSDVLSGQLTGAADGQITGRSGTTGYSAFNIYSVNGAVNLSVSGDTIANRLVVLSSINSSLPQGVQFAGVRGATNVTLTSTGGTNWLIDNQGTVQAEGTLPSAGLVTLVNPGAGTSFSGGRIVGALTTPTSDSQAGSAVQVVTSSGSLSVFNNRATTGSLTFQTADTTSGAINVVDSGALATALSAGQGINMTSAASLTFGSSGGPGVSVNAGQSSSGFAAGNVVINSDLTAGRLASTAGGAIALTSSGGSITTHAGILARGAGANGGDIQLDAQSGSIVIDSSGTVDASVASGDGSGGRVFARGATVSAAGIIAANANASGSGSGGEVVLLSMAGDLTCTGANASGSGTGSGGIITVVSGGPSSISNGSGFAAAPGATSTGSGGAINIFTASGVLNNGATIESNGAGGSTSADGGFVTIGGTGASTAASVNANGILVANNPSDTAAVLNAISATSSSGLTVTNSGLISASGASGTGVISLLSNNGTLIVRAAATPAGSLRTTGVISFQAQNDGATADIHQNVISGSVTGVADGKVSLESFASGMKVRDVVSQSANMELRVGGDLTIVSGTYGPVSFNGVHADAGIAIEAIAGSAFTADINDGAAIQADGHNTAFGARFGMGQVLLSNPGADIHVLGTSGASGGSILGAVTTPGGATAASSVEVRTKAGSLTVFDNAASSGSIVVEAQSATQGSLLVLDSAALTAGADVSLSAATVLSVGAEGGAGVTARADGSVVLSSTGNGNLNSALTVGRVSGNAGGSLQVTSTAGSINAGASVLAQGNGADGGQIRFDAHSGTVTVSACASVDASVSAGSGNGGRVFIEGDSVSAGGSIRAAAATEGGGGSVVVISGSGSLSVATIDATGKGSGGGGVATLVSNSSTGVLSMPATVDVSPGASAGPDASGGNINLLTAEGTLSNAGILKADGAGGAQGGTIVVASTGPAAAAALSAFKLSSSIQETTDILTAVGSGAGAGLTVSNTGSISASGSAGSGLIYLLAAGNGIAVNSQSNCVGAVTTSGTFAVEAPSGGAAVYLDSIVGTTSGAGQSVTVQTASSGLEVQNVVATESEVNLTMAGNLSVKPGVSGVLSRQFSGVSAGTNVNIRSTAGAELLVTNDAVISASGQGSAFGLVNIANPHSGIKVSGTDGRIDGAVSTPISDADASTSVEVSTAQGNLGIYDNRATAGAIKINAAGGDAIIVQTSGARPGSPNGYTHIVASQEVDIKAAGNIAVGRAGLIGSEAGPSGTEIRAGGFTTVVDTASTLPAGSAAGGALKMTATGGSIVLGANSNLTSYGSDIWLVSGREGVAGLEGAGGVIPGQNSHITAYGGDIYVRATKGLTWVDGNWSLTSIAMLDPAGPNNVTDPATGDRFVYRGGGIFIMAGSTDTSGGTWTTFLAGKHQSRTADAQGFGTATLIGLPQEQAHATSGGLIEMGGEGDFSGLGNGNLNLNAQGGVIVMLASGGAIRAGADPSFNAVAPRIGAAPQIPPCVDCNIPCTDCEPIVPPEKPVVKTVIIENRVQPKSETVTQKDQQQSMAQQVILPPQARPCTPTAFDSGEQRAEPDGSGVTGWQVAGGACQPFSFEGDDGTVVIGAGGSTFASSQNRTLLLKEGKLVTMAGQQGVVVKTVQGEVRISGGTAAMIEQKASGVVSIANLAGGGTDVAVTNGRDTKVLSAQPGEELVVAEAALAEEEYIPVDGIDRTPISGGIAVEGVRVLKRKFDRQGLASREVLLSCNTGCFTITMRKKFDWMKQDLGNTSPLVSDRGTQHLKAKSNSGESAIKAAVSGKSGIDAGQAPSSSRLKAALPAGNGRQVQAKNSDAGSGLIPIGFVQPSAMSTGANSGVFTLATGSAQIRQTGHARMVVEQPGVFNLKSGQTLITAAKKTVVNAGAYKVAIDPGTIAMLCREGDVVKIRNLIERSAKSVRVFAGKHVFQLAVGQEALISPNYGATAKALKSEAIGRRRIRALDLADGHSVIRCEVSIVSLIQQTELLNRIFNSKNGHDRAITARLLKMSAVIQQVQMSHGAYVPVER